MRVADFLTVRWLRTLFGVVVGGVRANCSYPVTGWLAGGFIIGANAYRALRRGQLNELSPAMLAAVRCSVVCGGAAYFLC